MSSDLSDFGASSSSPPPVHINSLKGRVWVTRTSPHIDRLASAWLIRRFIDSKAKFKFVKEPYKPAQKELRFDMAEGEFTHFGDWCSFETFLHRIQLKDPALKNIAEIIHDIDLKDRKFARLEAAGIDHLVRGLCKIYSDDHKRVEASLSLFDALYASGHE
jgi:hypothetical protein